MGKLTFAGILVIFSLTGAAYIYLPDNPKPPTAQQSQPPSRPGRSRRYRESEKMPLEVAAFGLGVTAFYLWIVNSNLEEMDSN